MTNEKGKIRERKLCIWRCNYGRVNACCYVIYLSNTL